MKTNILLSLFLLIVLMSCKKEPDVVEQEPQDIDVQYAKSDKGMVAAAHPLATQAGNEILEAGGNAADAALATAFAIAVVEPTMNSIAGRNLILIRTTEGDFQGYNGMTEVPASYTAPESPVTNGFKTIATPGVIASLMRLYNEHGSLPLEQIMAPAIKYAAEGFEILPGEAIRHKMAYKDIIIDPGFRRQMLKQDTILYKAGEILKQPDLANSLQRIADTKGEDFYRGEIAEKIVSSIQENEGYVNLEDLQNYKATDMRYITTDYRGYQIHAMPAPSGGGLLIKTLNVMEQFDLTVITDSQWAAVVNQALAIALNSMEGDYKENDLELVQSKVWAGEQSKSVVIPEDSSSKSVLNFEEISVNDLALNTDWGGSTWGEDSHHTTHFVTADCKGTVVSITQTIGPLFGSKVITPGLGFVYATTMGKYLSEIDQFPGSRPRTTIAPTIVTKDGKVVMVLGAAGGLRILSGIAQTISRHIDRGLNYKESLAAPRVHPEFTIDTIAKTRRFEGMKFSAEFTPKNGWSASDSLVWKNAGFKIQPIERYGAFSRVHAMFYDHDEDVWVGVADPDWEGTALGPDLSACEFN